ncbi:MAG: molybdopterin-dependent oxidoreductase [Nitrospirota bacterium]
MCGVSCAQTNVISVLGEVNTPLKLSSDDIKNMERFHMNKVTLIKEKKRPSDPEELLSVHNYKGVLLRDILEKAGMKYVRKWEPGVYFRVKGSGNRQVTFSFGEIFYSSIGSSVLIAYEKDGKPIAPEDGLGEMIIATDIRAGREIAGVIEIIVERVDVEMQVYEDRKKNIIRPPTSEFLLIDKKNKKSANIKLVDLKKMDSLHIRDVVMTGDCEGFHGIYSFRGVPLRSLLENVGIDPWNQDYNRYVLIYSENGFSATFSFGEIFNSRLSDNIIIAYEKDGKGLDETEGFARSAVREDAMGGRSVKRIYRIEIR